MSDVVEKQPLTEDYLKKMDAYWRAANYLGAAQLYLLDNPLITITAILPSLTEVMKFAIMLSTPVFSRPATETNKPMKKSSVL